MSVGAFQNGWVILAFPLFAEDGDALGRPVDALLWPERFREPDFPSVGRGEISSRSFAALYQQRPVPLDGDLIKAAWLEHRYDRLPDDLRITMALDAAAKTGINNDWSALSVIGTNKTHHYLIDMIRKKVDYPGLKRMLIAAADQYNPSRIYVEDASNATALIADLRHESRLPILPVIAKGSKISRIEAQTGLLESGNVLLPSDSVSAPWMLDFMREMLALPNGKHDDMADALVLNLAQEKRGSAVFGGYVIPDESDVYPQYNRGWRHPALADRSIY